MQLDDSGAWLVSRRDVEALTIGRQAKTTPERPDQQPLLLQASLLQLLLVM